MKVQSVYLSVCNHHLTLQPVCAAPSNRNYLTKFGVPLKAEPCLTDLYFTYYPSYNGFVLRGYRVIDTGSWGIADNHWAISPAPETRIFPPDASGNERWNFTRGEGSTLFFFSLDLKCLLSIYLSLVLKAYKQLYFCVCFKLCESPPSIFSVSVM